MRLGGGLRAFGANPPYGLKPHDFGYEMSNGEAGDYLPGDPRHGLQGEALKDYYRKKPAQWAIYCWDKEGAAERRRA